jgi:hypothetical protein
MRLFQCGPCLLLYVCLLHIILAHMLISCFESLSKYQIVDRDIAREILLAQRICSLQQISLLFPLSVDIL